MVADTGKKFLRLVSDILNESNYRFLTTDVLILSPRIHSAGEAFIKIYQAGGVRGLWKGCAPNVYRSAFVNLGDLTTYDSVKRYFMASWGMGDNYWTHALSR